MDRFHYWLTASPVTKKERRVKAFHSISRFGLLSTGSSYDYNYNLVYKPVQQKKINIWLEFVEFFVYKGIDTQLSNIKYKRTQALFQL